MSSIHSLVGSISNTRTVCKCTILIKLAFSLFVFRFSTEFCVYDSNFSDLNKIQTTSILYRQEKNQIIIYYTQLSFSMQFSSLYYSRYSHRICRVGYTTVRVKQRRWMGFKTSLTFLRDGVPFIQRQSIDQL